VNVAQSSPPSLPSLRPRLWLLATGVFAAGLVAVTMVAGSQSADATERIRATTGMTIESIAEQFYGDVRKAPIIRAANRMGDTEQPADGATLKLPGSVVHTVVAGETMQKVADRFCSAEGGAALLAEANNLRVDAALAPGQVLTVFAEVEVRTNGRRAEDLAMIYLGDANMGARLRRYNGVKDGAKLPAKAFIPLLGVEPRRAGAVAPAVAVAPVAASAAPPTAATPAPPAAPPAPTPQLVVVQAAPPAAAPAAPATSPVVVPLPPPLSNDVPVTSKMASLVGFSHALHSPMLVQGKPVACVTCHQRTAPGSIEHAAPSQQNCALCHRNTEPLPAELRQGQVRTLPLPMNHELHVGQTGLDCTICHVHQPDRPIGMANMGHDACSACHKQGGTVPYVNDDVSCTGCHGTAEEEPVSEERQRHLRAHMIRPFGRVGDVFFTHVTHASFAPGGVVGGQPEINCRACHADAWTAVNKEQIAKVGMQGCMECHRQANQVGLQPPTSCAGCHLHHDQGNMPMNSMVLTKPLDHTTFFRRHHADAARDNAPMCASCHQGVDPNDGARCDTCHTVMKPRDHTAGFRDRVHGRQAQVDPARCTTCHRAERCESCHREPPKSHFPQETWVGKGTHGSRARMELSSCMTCHRFEQTCQRCHSAVQN
jgi:LysM repeat protein